MAAEKPKQEETKQQEVKLIERVINLELLNEKINYIITDINEIKEDVKVIKKSIG